jgi:hypothetical protein
MCGLCGSFAHGHWNDGVADAARTPTAERMRRSAGANEVLALYGLTLREWAGRFTLTSRTGRASVIDGFGGLWPAAERLSGRLCDPLDEDLLRRLEARRR